MPPGEPPVHKGKSMDYLLDIVRTLLLSVAALVVCFLLALAGFILIYGDKGREERSLPPRSRRQLLRILVCTLIPRLFAVLVLRRPLTEDEARHMRRKGRKSLKTRKRPARCRSGKRCRRRLSGRSAAQAAMRSGCGSAGGAGTRWHSPVLPVAGSAACLPSAFLPFTSCPPRGTTWITHDIPFLEPLPCRAGLPVCCSRSV